MVVFAIVASVVGFALLGWFDWQARQRVRSIRAAQDAREVVRYLPGRREGDR
ncbi:hypothetical protein ACFXDE_01605 [Kitasatospora sp. NPDC059408]|uniref:hypothetical protein n=1 Tax=Kitasatospora sp. NPDC059408 TaxID=3346823 RepID=UPI00368F61B1